MTTELLEYLLSLDQCSGIEKNIGLTTKPNKLVVLGILLNQRKKSNGTIGLSKNYRYYILTQLLY